jgi:hypothetical protein
MNLEKKRRTILLSLMLILAILALIAASVAGCSLKKAKAADSGSPAGDVGALAGVEEAERYTPVEDDVLTSIRDSYSDDGIKIVSIELKEGQDDGASIVLEFPEHNVNQAALAGLSILRDNFPRMSSYISKVGRKEYECSAEELAYISSYGYSFECTEEEAEIFIGVVKNGIPEEGIEMPVEAEAV